MFCPKCGNRLDSPMAFCNQCGNMLEQNSAPTSLYPHKKSKKVLIVIGSPIIAIIILMGVFSVTTNSTFNFIDSSVVKCSLDRDSTENCAEISNGDSPNIDIPTNSKSVGNIGPIKTTDPVEYRTELVKKLKEINDDANANCDIDKAKSAEKSFEEKAQPLYADLCAMDPAYITGSLNILNKLYQKFPNAIAKVDLFSIEDLEDGVYGGFQPKEIRTGNKSISTTVSGLTLSSKLFTTKNIEKPKKYYERDLQEKFHPKNTNFMYVYAHEVAHDMEYMLALHEVGVKDLWASDDINDQYDLVDIWNSYAISKKIVKEAVENINSGSNKFTEAELIEDISGYAAQKDDDGQQIYSETLAEAVTDYLANGNESSKLTLEIIPLLSREMDKL